MHEGGPAGLRLPPGYRAEPLVVGLSLPSAITFGPGGELYVAEAGQLGSCRVGVPRVLRIDTDGTACEIGRLDYAITGLAYRNDELLIAENGPACQILSVAADGAVRAIVSGLPGGGDYGISSLAVDAKGCLYFGLGTRTNSGVVGLDNLAAGWAVDYPEFCDVFGLDVELVGVNYVTSGSHRTATGGLSPFGTRTTPGQRIDGHTLCGGAVFRLTAEGTEIERVACGMRNPVGVSIAPDGRIYATEGGMEARGSRPVAGASDNLWEIRTGQFYGWPDYSAGRPVSDPEFRLPGQLPVQPLLRNTPTPPSQPLVQFPNRSGVGRLAFSISDHFGFAGEAFVALSGPWTPPLFGAGEEAGGSVVRVDLRARRVHEFLRWEGEESGGLHRPLELAFDPSGDILYVADLGPVEIHPSRGLRAFGGEGVVWRITRIASAAVSLGGSGETGEEAEAEGDEEDLETVDDTRSDEEDDGEDSGDFETVGDSGGAPGGEDRPLETVEGGGDENG